MSVVLIVAERQPDGQLRKATLHAVAAGADLAAKAQAELHLAVVADNPAPLTGRLRDVGAKVIHTLASPGFVHYLAETYTPPLAELAKSIGANFVGAAATAQGRDLLPRLAARLRAAMASDVLAFSGSGADVAFTRPMWAGAVLADVKLKTALKAFTIRATEFPAAAAGQSPAEVKVFPVGALPPSPTVFVDFKEVKSARPELTEARIVISGGRGTKGDFTEVEALADELGAAVGASRAAADAGWVPNDWQVGQTGKVVAPQLYVAAGISGAIQHLAGMKGSKVIVAINKDPEAPIFQVADYGIVGDLFKVLPELRAAIHSSK